MPIRSAAILYVDYQTILPEICNAHYSQIFNSCENCILIFIENPVRRSCCSNTIAIVLDSHDISISIFPHPPTGIVSVPTYLDTVNSSSSRLICLLSGGGQLQELVQEEKGLVSVLRENTDSLVFKTKNSIAMKNMLYQINVPQYEWTIISI